MVIIYVLTSFQGRKKVLRERNTGEQGRLLEGRNYGVGVKGKSS
jgi:hypothetical protein